jgi:hypothetical protein
MKSSESNGKSRSIPQNEVVDSSSLLKQFESRFKDDKWETDIWDLVESGKETRRNEIFIR